MEGLIYSCQAQGLASISLADCMIPGHDDGHNIPSCYCEAWGTDNAQWDKDIAEFIYIPRW